MRFKEFEGEWKKYSFYECISITNGMVDPRLPQYQTLPHIGAANIEKETGMLTAYKTSAEDNLVSSKYLFDIDDVIYIKVRPYFAKAALPKFIGLCSADAYPLKPKKNLLLSYFLLQLVIHPKFTRFTSSISKRTGMPKVNRDDLASYQLDIPSIKEQTIISAFFSLLDRRIETQIKIIEDLKILKKELCNKVFNSSFCDNEVEIRQIASVYGGYAFNSKTYVSAGKYKIVTIGNVTGDRYISNEFNSIDKLPDNIQKQQILNNGDILISLTGNVGRIAIVNGDNYLLNQRVAKVKIDDNLIKEYFFQYLSNSSFEKDMGNAGQGAAQKNIKNEDILSYTLRIPTNQIILEKIDSLLSAYDKLIANEKTILSDLQLQKNFLLNAMFI